MLRFLYEYEFRSQPVTHIFVIYRTKSLVLSGLIGACQTKNLNSYCSNTVVYTAYSLAQNPGLLALELTMF